MNTRFKVFASYNIFQYLCDFIHVLIFVIVPKCRKSPKLTNIVIIGNDIANQLTNDGTTLDKPTSAPRTYIVHTIPYWLIGTME